MLKLAMSYCINHDIISKADIPILEYHLRKSIVNNLFLIPLFAIGIIISDALTTVSFLGTFYYLRKYMNGFHAKTLVGCFILSVFAEVVLLSIAKKEYPLLMIVFLVLPSSLIVWFLSPFNHPNMGLSDVEYVSCKYHSRLHLTILLLILVVSSILAEHRIENGICFGIILASGMLGLAYIIEGRDKNA